MLTLWKFSSFQNLTQDPIITSDLINQIQANYKASLNDKLKTLEALWTTSDNNYSELLAYLHQLAGSAGMYGYNQISAQCLQMQSAIKDTNCLEKIQREYHLLKGLIEKSIENQP